MHILSFDCANRSLAVCYATINTNILDDLADARDKKDAEKCVELIDGHIKIHVLKVFDLTKGKKVDTIKRTQLLKECLNSIDQLVLDSGTTPDQVLVEYQMSANDKSRCVSQQIIYHHAGRPNVDVALVGPTLKNKVCFSPDETLAHGTFMAKYASKYTANKNHCKANFLHWLKLYRLDGLLKENGIAKKNVDDIADAFMQMFGWLDFSSTRKR